MRWLAWGWVGSSVVALGWARGNLRRSGLRDETWRDRCATLVILVTAVVLGPIMLVWLAWSRATRDA